MKTTKTAVILLVLVLLTTAAAGAQSAEKPTKKEISNTRIASCLVKITTNEAVLPLNEFAIDYLVRSSGVAGKAAREILGISPDIAHQLFEIEEIYNLYPDSGGRGSGYGGGARGIGIPLGTTVPGRRSPTPAKTPTGTATTRTTRPGSIGTTTTIPLPRPPTRRKPTVTQPQPSTTEQTILFPLRVDLQYDEDIKPAAEEFMNALIENLRSALRGAFDQYNDKLNNQLQLADKEAIRAEQKLVQMQNDLSNISDSRDLSRSVILSNISNLRRQLQDIIMHQASQEIYIQATTNQIVETQAKVAEQLQKDPITIELKGIADIHTKSLENIQKLVKAGRASSDKVEEVLEKLARARIELAKRREQISNSAGGNKLDRLNTELAEYSLNMAQNEVSTSNLKNQIAEAEAFLAKADDYELLSLKADISKQNLEEALLWRDRLGRNIRSIQPPDVTVIGAE